ncbi:MAG: hypothetical protein AAF358_04650 [Pseudomonadota bacterium]
MEALLYILLSVVAVGSAPAPISEVMGSDRPPRISASPGGTIRWRLPSYFPVYFDNVTVDILELSREPTSSEGFFVLVGQLMINEKVVSAEHPLRLSEEASAPSRFGQISVFEQFDLATQNRHLIVVFENHLNPVVFVVKPDGMFITEDLDRLDPGRTETGRRFVAASGGAADFFAARGACVDALAEVENIWQMGRRRDVHPCLDALPDKIFELLNPRRESRQSWLEIAGLEWAIEELKNAEPRRALAVLRLAREMRTDAAGATAIDFFEVALQYPDIEVQKRALFIFEQWASLYGFRTSDVVPRGPPPPNGTSLDPSALHGSWGSETERATSEFFRIRPIIDDLAESDDPELAVLAAYALNEAWPVGEADHMEHRLLEILKSNANLKVLGWLRPSSVLARDGIAIADVERQLVDIALNATDLALVHQALGAVLQTKPAEPVAQKLFPRMFTLLNDPSFSGEFLLLYTLIPYPELSLGYLITLQEMKKEAEAKADQHWRFCSRANKIQEVIDLLHKADHDLRMRE